MDTDGCYQAASDTKRLSATIKASELIDPAIGTWDSQLVRDIFGKMIHGIYFLSLYGQTVKTQLHDFD